MERHLISLISAVLLLFSGAEVAVGQDDRVVGGMLIAAGLVVLGVWVALEVQYERHREDERHDHSPDT